MPGEKETDGKKPSEGEPEPDPGAPLPPIPPGNGIQQADRGGDHAPQGKGRRQWLPKDIRNAEWIMIGFTACTALAACISAYAVLRQTKIMDRQLAEMRGASAQTDRIIELQSQLNGTAGFTNAVTDRLRGFARTQADNSGRLADISDRQSLTAREGSRASVFARSINYRVENTIAGGAPIYSLSVVWANSGTTETRKLLYRQYFGSKVELGKNLSWKKFLDDHNTGWDRAYVGAGATQEIASAEGLTSYYVTNLLDPPNKGLYGVGEAKYFDIYGKRHYTSFCYEGHISTTKLHDLYFVPCRDAGAQYNCSDGACEKEP